MKTLKILVFFLLLVNTAYAQEKPNIVFVLTDQWRSSALGYSGNNVVKTPNLDNFAKEAINIKNTVSVTPVCTPYRASLLTGRYPTSTGMFLNDIYLPTEELCIAEIYKEAGYNTGYLGKWHLDGHGREENVAPERRQGFDYWKAIECSHDYNNMPYYENDQKLKKYWEGYSPFALVKDAQKYMEEQVQEKTPFLLFVSLATPHYPHHSAPEEFKNLYNDEQFELNPNVPVALEELVYDEIKGYYAHSTATDKAIGDLINKMKELKIYDNSIIVFTSDHGEMMGAHGRKPFRKQLPWNESAHVPFLISYPGMGNNKGKTLNAPISTPDILPSLLGLSRIKIPGTIEGEDLSELIKECDPTIDRAALFMNICPFDVNVVDFEYRALRTKQYTYVKAPDSAAMLFDNINDPFQLNNLVNHPALKEVQENLEIQLRQKLEKIGDTNFKHREYYLNKWGFILNTKKKDNIRYDFPDGQPHVVQSPKKSNLKPLHHNK